LVGLGEPDDAAVYRLNDEQAIIITTDFFTPIVDDPYHYGAIAAANALSDVYAMGGTPIVALNLAALPADLPNDISAEIMRGLADKVFEAGAVIAGGHSIQDKEPKVGLAVVGIIHPNKLIVKAKAKPGDILVLTKPLGTGVITTGAKNDRTEAGHVDQAVAWMLRLNRTAAQAAIAAGANALTDITGFGLMGHGLEVANLSGVTLRIEAGALHYLPGVRAYADQWIFPGGAMNNVEAFADRIDIQADLTEPERMLLYDPQTSGGLLVALPSAGLAAFRDAMGENPWWQIGTVVEKTDAGIIVT
jgi:selenide, water dikinase